MRGRQVLTAAQARPKFDDADYQRFDAYLRDSLTVRRYNAVVFVDRGPDGKARGPVVVREPTTAELADDWRAWDAAAPEPSKLEVLVQPPDPGLPLDRYEGELFSLVVAELARRAGIKDR